MFNRVYFLMYIDSRRKKSTTKVLIRNSEDEGRKKIFFE